jgi:hypothetical protein
VLVQENKFNVAPSRSISSAVLRAGSSTSSLADPQATAGGNKGEEPGMEAQYFKVPRAQPGGDEMKLISGETKSLSRGLTGLRAPMRAKGSAAGINLPPRLQISPTVTHKYRFRSTSGALITITNGNILGALGGIASSATALRTWASAYKIHSITVWPSASTSSADQVNVLWEGGAANQVPDELVDVSIPEGLSVSTALRFTPDPKSLNGFWQNSSLAASTAMFAIQAPAGSVVDFEVTFRLSNVFNGDSITLTSSGGAGVISYLALDGAVSGTYIPVGLPTAE